MGRTPLLELKNLTALVRSYGPARPRRAGSWSRTRRPTLPGVSRPGALSLSVHQAAQGGISGVIAATSGNYGAAVASQAAMRNLRCIVVQEAFDSRGVGQPEILEKGRACEAYGAEVWQLTVGPELFYFFLLAPGGDGLFQRLALYPLQRGGNRDARLRDRPRDTGQDTAANRRWWP